MPRRAEDHGIAWTGGQPASEVCETPWKAIGRERGPPTSVAETRLPRASPSQAAPTRSRSSSCRDRCSRNDAATGAGSGIVRLLRCVFGSVRCHSPPWRSNERCTFSVRISRSMSLFHCKADASPYRNPHANATVKRASKRSPLTARRSARPSLAVIGCISCERMGGCAARLAALRPTHPHRIATVSAARRTARKCQALPWA